MCERVADELACSVAIVGVEDRAQQRGKHRLLLAARVAGRFAEVVAAVLPGSLSAAIMLKPTRGMRERRCFVPFIHPVASLPE